MKPTIRFLFAMNNSWYAILSKLINYKQHGIGSHCAIELCYQNKNIVYESTYPVTKKTNYNQWLKHYKVNFAYEISISEDKCKDIEIYLESVLGTPFAFSQLLLIYIRLINKDLATWSRRVILNHNSDFICAELMARTQEKFFNIHFDRDMDSVDLEDVYENAKNILPAIA